MESVPFDKLRERNRLLRNTPRSLSLSKCRIFIANHLFQYLTPALSDSQTSTDRTETSSGTFCFNSLNIISASRSAVGFPPSRNGLSFRQVWSSFSMHSSRISLAFLKSNAIPKSFSFSTPSRSSMSQLCP